MKYICPICEGNLHVSYLGENITDAYCAKCNKEIDIKKIKKVKQ